MGFSDIRHSGLDPDLFARMAGSYSGLPFTVGARHAGDSNPVIPENAQHPHTPVIPEFGEAEYPGPRKQHPTSSLANRT